MRRKWQLLLGFTSSLEIQLNSLRSHHGRSPASISPYPQLPLSHQPIVCPLSHHPWIFSVVFFFFSCLAAQHPLSSMSTIPPSLILIIPGPNNFFLVLKSKCCLLVCERFWSSIIQMELQTMNSTEFAFDQYSQSGFHVQPLDRVLVRVLLPNVASSLVLTWTSLDPSLMQQEIFYRGNSHQCLPTARNYIENAISPLSVNPAPWHCLRTWEKANNVNARCNHVTSALLHPQKSAEDILLKMTAELHLKTMFSLKKQQ